MRSKKFAQSMQRKLSERMCLDHSKEASPDQPILPVEYFEEVSRVTEAVPKVMILQHV
jgi:hypothetical protein